MGWLREHGVSATYWEYLQLPIAVLEDCRLLMEAEALHHKLNRRA